MLIRTKSGIPEIPASEITPKETYMNRRKFMAAAAAGVAAVAGERMSRVLRPTGVEAAEEKLATVRSQYSTPGLTPTPFEDITHYNNFYEFGVNKDDPAKNAWRLRTRPWTIEVEGLVKQKKTFDIDTLLKMRPLEDRVYRFRCVEAWSMVIPWVGYSLSELINACDPLPSAKYVQFISLADSKDELLPWSAGIRGLIGRPAHGRSHASFDPAHLRPVRPGAAESGWRASACRGAVEVRIQIREVDREDQVCQEPASDHLERHGAQRVRLLLQRQSQPRSSPLEPEARARDRRLHPAGSMQPTLMFNGYGDQVAKLYTGMNLKKDY